MISEGKHHFYDMVATLQGKLDQLPVDSIIRQCFPASRLEEISNKIANTDCKDLEWGLWQPFFLFLNRSDILEIKSLEEDLQIVTANTRQGSVKILEFLKDEREIGSSWTAGLFEIFVKATFLRSNLVSVDCLNWQLPNNREVDIRVRIEQRPLCLECTTLGESDAGKDRWEDHCDILKQNPNKSFVESQDAYSPGRRLYGKIYDKIAPECNPAMSQLSADSPNLLLIGFFPLITDLRPTSPSIRWALDELFSIQPTGNTSNISLESYLRRQLQNSTSSLDELLSALTQISGVLLFNGCKLGHARINYNAGKDCLITHRDMGIIETIFANPPIYWH
jgi:hypothetical protein